MDLSGTWYNELNSTMVISVRPDGSLTGSYVSGVGGSAASLLVRQYDPNPGMSTNVGWVIDWRPYSSLTAWSGQAWDDPSGGATIAAMWHLTSETSEANQWMSTLDGKDVFTRRKKSDEEVAAAMRIIAPSHPHRE